MSDVGALFPGQQGRAEALLRTRQGLPGAETLPVMGAEAACNFWSPGAP